MNNSGDICIILSLTISIPAFRPARIWTGITPAYIQNLFGSIPKRIQQVIRLKGHLNKYQTVSNNLFQIKKFIYNSFPCPFDPLPVVSVNNAAIVTEYFLHVSVHVHSQCTFLFTFPVKRLNPPILLMFYRSMHWLSGRPQSLSLLSASTR